MISKMCFVFTVATAALLVGSVESSLKAMDVEEAIKNHNCKECEKQLEAERKKSAGAVDFFAAVRYDSYESYVEINSHAVRGFCDAKGRNDYCGGLAKGQVDEWCHEVVLTGQQGFPFSQDAGTYYCHESSGSTIGKSWKYSENARIGSYDFFARESGNDPEKFIRTEQCRCLLLDSIFTCKPAKQPADAGSLKAGDEVEDSVDNNAMAVVGPAAATASACTDQASSPAEVARTVFEGIIAACCLYVAYRVGIQTVSKSPELPAPDYNAGAEISEI